MKKIFAIIVLMLAVGNISTLLAGEYLEDAAWLQLRELHAKHLGRENDMTHGETEMWIAQNMNKWLREKHEKLARIISDLKSENNRLKTGNAKLTQTLKGDDNDSDETIIEQNQRLKGENSNLKGENSNLKDELECCKTLNNIAYSIIGIILVLFIAFILIKKCQAKKLPEPIKNSIAAQDK